MKVKGIDVSKHQGKIDWNKVKEAGIGFAILRVGYGDNVVTQDDDRFRENANACTALGIPFGAYIYSYATSVEHAKSEAEHMLRMLDGYKLSYPVYYDLEDEVTAACSNYEIEQIASTFATMIQEAGYTVGIYANKYWWTTHLTGSIYEQWERWVAQYYSECTYSGNYGMWQYGSAGRVDGISEPVDVNICYKDYPAIIAGTVEDAPVPAPVAELPDLSVYTGCSIAAALKECGYDNSYTYREQLAAKLGISGYQGTAEQNLDMLKQLGASVKSNAVLKAGAAVRIKDGAKDLNTGGGYANYVYKNTYTVISVKGDAVVFGIGKAVTGRTAKANVTLA